MHAHAKAELSRVSLSSPAWVFLIRIDENYAYEQYSAVLNSVYICIYSLGPMLFLTSTFYHKLLTFVFKVVWQKPNS